MHARVCGKEHGDCLPAHYSLLYCTFHGSSRTRVYIGLLALVQKNESSINRDRGTLS
jgi:hypothetical protein